MQKVFQRINWQNYPSEETPLNESNLNRVDYALDEIDDRVITLDTEKVNATTVNNLIKTISVDDATGRKLRRRHSSQGCQNQRLNNYLCPR